MLRGPFAGLRYAQLRTVASALSPKLLGTYEREIAAVVETCCTAGYEEILDIGCAEGYYAVGFARRCPEARVIACDASAEALTLCAENARANGVADRVEPRGPIDAAALAALPPGTRRLVFCDVDGFEAELFVPEAVPGLIGTDLLIETHDYLDPDITPDIVDTLRATHAVRILHSLDDVEKVYRYELPELDGLSRRTRLRLLAEGRPAVQRWLWCRPHDRAGEADPVAGPTA